MQKPSAWRVWWIAARPQTLWTAVCAVLLGSVLAWDAQQFDALMAAAALVAAVLIQVGTNYTNDYYDGIRGTDSHDRRGPLRVMQAGWVSAKAMRRAMALVFVCSLLVAWAVSLHVGWPIFVLAVLAVAAGYLYTGGPYPLGYHGLGDVFAFLFFGPIAVAGTYYVQTLQISFLAACVGLIPGAFSAALLTVNNIRDRDGDVRAGKKTLAVRWGLAFSRWEYVGCCVVAAVVPVGVSYVFYDKQVLFFTLPVFLLLVFPVKVIFNPASDGPSFNKALVRTAQVLLIDTLVFSVAWLW